MSAPNGKAIRFWTSLSGPMLAASKKQISTENPVGRDCCRSFLRDFQQPHIPDDGSGAPRRLLDLLSIGIEHFDYAFRTGDGAPKCCDFLALRHIKPPRRDIAALIQLEEVGGYVRASCMADAMFFVDYDPVCHVYSLKSCGD